MESDYTDLLPPNFPTKRPKRTPSAAITVPRDLVTDNRSFYTGIRFVAYDFFNMTTTIGNSSAIVAQSTPQIILPIPTKVNDVQTVVWEDESFMQQAASIASTLISNRRRAQNQQNPIPFGSIASAVGGFAGAAAGLALNPFLWMLFKQPAFKEYNFTWILTASNEEESNDIRTVINYLKENMLPGQAFPLYTYPNIALIKFLPNDKFMFRFKPCAVQSVAVDYTTAGPSFFKKTEAPTIITLSVSLKEIDLWTQQDYRQNAYR